jgi:hypothetical protein
MSPYDAVYTTWETPSSTGTISIFQNPNVPGGVFYVGANSTVCFPPVSPPAERRPKVYVIEETTETGKKTRARLEVMVLKDGSPMLAEEESEKLARLACEQIGARFIGKA